MPNLKKHQHIGFRDMSFLHGFNVALDPMCRFLTKLLKYFSFQLNKLHQKQKLSLCSLQVIKLEWPKILYFRALALALPWQRI